MIKTSQNRVAVNQANFAIANRGQVLSAAVVHQPLLSMCSHTTRSKRLPLGSASTYSESKRHASEPRLIKPADRDSGNLLPARMWARLVLSKMSRG